MTVKSPSPRLIVFSNMFPSAVTPTVGTPIKERMFRVAEHIPIAVISPQTWSPLDPVVRLFRSTFRPLSPAFEIMDGVHVYRPRVLSIPKFFKTLDGYLMASGSRSVFKKICAEFKPNIVDAHFLYPDGEAAATLAAEHNLPLIVTIRGSKDAKLVGTPRESALRHVISRASKLIAVSDSLKVDVADKLEAAPNKTVVVGNGVDLKKFFPEDKLAARTRLGIPDDAQVLIGVGGLVELKGFHRIIAELPELLKVLPKLKFLVVGGGTTQGNMLPQLKAQVQQLGLESVVTFCGPQAPNDLRWYLSASDLFVSATAYEGWANVLLEAMACGLPVVTTRVGGNSQVVNSSDLGYLVDYWDADQFRNKTIDAFRRQWDRSLILNYAGQNSWEFRVQSLLEIYRDVLTAWDKSSNSALAENSLVKSKLS